MIDFPTCGQVQMIENLLGVIMIPDNHAKSYLSQSYVMTIATQAGYTCQFSNPDYGIDATISEVQCLKSGKCVSTGHQFNIQMKATHDFIKNENEIIYDLEAVAYNKLIYHTGGLIILVLFCLPKNPDDRIHLTEDCLELRNCCYWYRINGGITNNSSSKTIHIPRSQLFNPNICIQMMNSTKSGNWKENNS